MIYSKIIVFLFILQTIYSKRTSHTEQGFCEKSLTTVSGNQAPDEVCVGKLIFEDDFKRFDFKKWSHENTLSGGGNWEFEWYTNNRSNSFVKDGVLYIKPTLTADAIGEENLSKMTVDINGASPADYCTDSRFWGCLRTGTPRNILNPVRSVKLTTVNSFSFKYGKVQVKAKIPSGDWLWPAIWLMPRYNVYGTWPSSGEIDILESRGNEKLIDETGKNIGTEQVSSTLHWGPDHNAYKKTTFSKNSPGLGFNNDFRVYELMWTPDYLKFSVDGSEIGTIQPNETLWKLGEFDSIHMDNPWKSGTKIAPFDDEFYLIINLAVGGVNGYFPDTGSNPVPKPWSNKSPHALTDFWAAKEQWLPTWKLETDNGAFKIDYVKIWAL